MPADPLSIEALQVPDIVAARLTGVSRATWWRLHAAGKTPAAIKLGRKVLWNRAELEVRILGCKPQIQAKRFGPGARRACGVRPIRAI
jgi:predicted DNA-binding transcriptional regulator AlpA